MKTFHLTIAKIGENLFDGEVMSASLPGSEGVFEVRAEHEAFVSELIAGRVRVTTPDGEKQFFDIAENGLAEVSQNQATVPV